MAVSGPYHLPRVGEGALFDQGSGSRAAHGSSLAGSVSGMAVVGSPGGDRKSTTSELQSLMRISYAVFCLKKKKDDTQTALRYQQIWWSPVSVTREHLDAIII